MASLFFPNKTIQKMSQLGLSESDIEDVWKNGEEFLTKDGGKMIVKKYPAWGYEIGLMYGNDKLTNRYVILSVWKRERK